MTHCLVCTHADAGHRYACPGCVDTMRHRLREVETYAAMLPAMLARGQGGFGIRAPGFHSEPPVRIEALIALDARSRPLALGRPEQVWDPECDEEDPTPGILHTLNSLACWIREEQEQPTRPSPSITSEIGYLLGAVDWCAQHQWVDDLAEQIRRLHARIRPLCHDRPPGPLAGCMTIDCAGQVYWTQGREMMDAARCTTCGRLYTGIDLIRLRVVGRTA